MRRRIVALLLVLLVIAAAAVAAVARDDDDGDGIVAELRERLGLDDDSDTITGSGYLEGHALNVAAELPGRVWAVPVRIGAEVQAGAVLAELEDAAVTAQQAQAVAALEAAHARLAEVESGPSADRLRQLSAARDEARQAEQQAVRALDAARAAASAQAVQDELAGAHDVAAARLEVAEAALALAMAGAPPQAIRAAQAGVRSAEAALQTADLQAERLTLRAPVSGTVTLLALRVGEAVVPGGTVARIVQPGSLSLVIYVSEAELERLEIGQEAEVRVDGLDQSFDGEVVALAQEAEFTPRNVQTKEDRRLLSYAVTLRVADERGRLRSGAPADAEIDVR